MELGRVSSEDNEACLGTKYLEKDTIKKCVAKMGMVCASPWVGKQVPVVTDIEEIFKENLNVCQSSFMMGVLLLVAVGVEQLLRWRGVALVSHPPIRKVTREPEVAQQPVCMTTSSMQIDVIDNENDMSESGYRSSQGEGTFTQIG